MKISWFISPIGQNTNKAVADMHLAHSKQELEVVGRLCHDKHGNLIGSRSGWEVSERELQGLEMSKSELPYETFRRVGKNGRWKLCNYQEILRSKLVKESVTTGSALLVPKKMNLKKRTVRKFTGVH